jgi:NAD(P)-dependent dehydrogenase (short-subunit alcohol dehydrogenase family)
MKESLMTLKGKTVVVTGASRGIGAAAARAFGAEGANVVLTARSADPINALAAEIIDAGGSALARPSDVSRFHGLNRVMEVAVETFGSLDVLINNAGLIDPISHLAAADPEDWGKTIDTNLKGVFYGMRAALPLMLPGGTIITVSSGAAHNALEGWSAYCASKAGAAMLTLAADKEERERGIRVMGLSPGTVATEMQDIIRASGVNPVSQLDPSAHIPPEWVANALLWMCSKDADEYLGQEISLRDEGIRARIGIGA